MTNILKPIFTRNSKLNIEQLIVKKTVVSFFFFFVFAGAAFWGWKRLRHETPSANGTRPLLRNVLNANESIFKAFLSDNHTQKNTR